MEREVSEEGQTAITHYEVIRQIQEKYALVKLELGTGRTHQIRVHLSHIGTPILGDTLYGKETDVITRQALHAQKITFIHPIIQNNVEIIAPIPDDIANIIN